MSPRRAGWSGGQIVLPSLLVIPSLMLFVYLIYETAKLSREKIRHQFALDSAAFVEMTNYADFMNRSAYVNGAFPQRIFAEGFMKGPLIPMKKDDSQTTSLYDILYCNGAFPRHGDSQNGLDPLDKLSKWDIEFNKNSTCGDKTVEPDPNSGNDFSSRNSRPSAFNLGCQQQNGNTTPDCLSLITKQNALQYYISWEDAQDIYKLYVQIYQLLGSVEDAQYSVFKRLTGGGNPHTFFRKSYWLNTGDSVSMAGEGAAYFSAHTFTPKAQCISAINIVGNKPTNDPYQPYKQVEPQNPIPMPQTVNQDLCSSSGLFQVVWIDQGMDDFYNSSSLSPWPGYGIIEHWNAPSNYFKVNFGDVCDLPGGGGPCVHATIGLTNTGSVWPDPTPKFQTRLFP